MKGKKKKKKSSTMVTKVTKVVTKEIPEDKKDQNFFKKPQMDKASRMAPPDAADENFYEKFIELMNSPSETDVDCQIHEVQDVKDEAEVNDLQERKKMLEDCFQLKFRNKWDKNSEKEKILGKIAAKYPTRSVSNIISDKVMLMYIKCKEEQVKSRTYQEMMDEEMKKKIDANEKSSPLMNRLKSLLKEKPVISEKEMKVVDAIMKQHEATDRNHGIKMQWLQTKIDEHSKNAEEWRTMVTTHRKELQKELQLGKQQEKNLEKVKMYEFHTLEDEGVLEMDLE